MARHRMEKSPSKEVLNKTSPENREEVDKLFKYSDRFSGCLLSSLKSLLFSSGKILDDKGQQEGTNSDSTNKDKKNGVIFRLCLFSIYFGLLFVGLWKINTIEQYSNIAIDDNGNAKTNIHNTCFFSFHDVSQSRYIINPTNNCNMDTICIDLGINAVFTPQEVEPDRTTLTSIIFTDKDKVETIKAKGLSFYAKFPDQQNKQSVRFFILTALMTLCLQNIFSACSSFLLKCYFRLREKGRMKHL